ncbi:ABC transporter substrate-binding protein [Bremerella sp. JC817]|uniref:ABC transporter substrate-binding protein n=1 Tax=Bremerella sp. JC817 TaxID=3231756 RepID=UPI00345A60DC
MAFRKFVLVLLLISAFENGGCSPQQKSQSEHPKTNSLAVTDLAGREVIIPQPVERIVLMRSLCLYELATVLGDETGSRLVGWDSSLKTGDRDAYDKFVERFPELAQVTELGDVLKDAVSAEAVLGLKPDLVIMNTYMRQRKSIGVERLEAAGVPILYLEFDDPFRDPQRSIRLLGKVLGRQQRADEAADWVDAQLDEVLGHEFPEDKPSIYMEAGTYGASQYGNTFGRTQQGAVSNWASVLDQLPCRNVADGAVSGMYGLGVIRPEYLLTSDPEIVVVTGAHWTSFPDSLRLGYLAEEKPAQAALQAYSNREGWSELNAVKHRKVYGLHTRFGSHITSFAAAQQLAKWIDPEKFAHLNPLDSLREFHEEFLPIEFSGTWIVQSNDE